MDTPRSPHGSQSSIASTEEDSRRPCIEEGRPDVEYTSDSLYQELDTSKPEIRLLRIRPLVSGSIGSEALIQCSLVTTTLSDSTLYDALSYAWRLSRPRMYEGRLQLFHIELHGQSVEVGENLYEALLMLRELTYPPDLIWVDALCINQRDDAERSHQVTLMKRIYSFASTVQVWLGTEGRDTNDTFDAIRSVAEGAALETLLHSSNGCVAGLKELLDRDWWTRLWVVQEATLGKSCIAGCGKARMDFRDVMSVLRRLEDLVGGVDGSFNEMYANALENDLEGLNRIVAIFEGKQDLARCPWARREVLKLFADTGGCEASDERDYIFGVLGLLPESLSIPPDYRPTTTVEEVFERAALRIMHWTGSIELLYGVERGNDSLNLPSWVPSFHWVWGRNLVVKPTKTRARIVIEQEREGELSIPAMLVDVVKDVGVTCPELNAWHQYDGERLEACRQILISWWKIAIKSLSTSPKSHDKLNFWRLLLLSGTQFPNGQIAAGVEAHQAVRELHQWLDTGIAPTKGRTFSKLLLDLFDSIDCASFFITQRGHMGLIRARTQAADVLAFLGDLERPFMLRSHPEGRQINAYKLLSMCHCPDLVDAREKDAGVTTEAADVAYRIDGMIDLLQASGIEDSQTYHHAAVELKHMSPRELHGQWCRMRQAVTAGDAMQGLALRLADDDAETATHIINKLQEDLLRIEGPASADASPDQLILPGQPMQAVALVQYCRAAQAAWVVATHMVLDYPPDSGRLEQLLAYIIKAMTEIVFARAVRAVYVHCSAVPDADLFETRMVSIFPTDKAREHAMATMHAYCAAVERIQAMQDFVSQRCERITLT